MLEETSGVSKEKIEDLYNDYLKTKEEAKDAWKKGVKYGNNVIPFTHRALASLGVEAGTGVTLSSLLSIFSDRLLKSKIESILLCINASKSFEIKTLPEMIEQLALKEVVIYRSNIPLKRNMI